MGARLLSCSLCPARQTSLIKPRDVDSRGSSSPFQNRSLPSDRLTHRADVRSQFSVTSRHISPLCSSVCPSGPTGRCYAQIGPPTTIPPPSFLLTLSYYWWLHWLAWDFHCHHASVLGRLSHPTGTHRSCWQCSTQVLQENEELKSFVCCYNISVYCSVFFYHGIDVYIVIFKLNMSLLKSLGVIWKKQMNYIWFD